MIMVGEQIPFIMINRSLLLAVYFIWLFQKQTGTFVFWLLPFFRLRFSRISSWSHGWVKSKMLCPVSSTCVEVRATHNQTKATESISLFLNTIEMKLVPRTKCINRMLTGTNLTTLPLFILCIAPLFLPRMILLSLNLHSAVNSQHHLLFWTQEKTPNPQSRKGGPQKSSSVPSVPQSKAQVE